MNDIGLATPGKRVTAWVAETDPKYAEAWLASLPLADSATSAREIYQALYTLNRQDIEPQRRLELMELYFSPAGTAINGLQAGLTHASFPLSPRRRQLAEFIRQLQMEMATGYKCVLKDLVSARFLWGKRQLYPRVSLRALFWLGDLLLRCYQAYLPTPPGVWKEIHELFRFAENGEWVDESVPVSPADGAAVTTIRATYLRIAMLALARPYQMPQGECLLANRYIGQWVDRVAVTSDLECRNPVACFLVDLASDGPPVAMPKERPEAGTGLRRLNAIELVRKTHGLVVRLNKGEAARALDIGFEALDAVSHDVLQRLVRAWGFGARRRHTRLRRKGYVSLCAGLGAIHFFASEQRPFAVVPDDEDRTVTLPVPPAREPDDGKTPSADGGSVDIDLDAPLAGTEGEGSPALPAATELYRIDRWLIRDISQRGLLLVGEGDTPVHVRVGELLGIQRADQIGTWSIAVARWLRNSESGHVEMGLEHLAPRSTPAAVCRDGRGRSCSPALLLPAVESLKRPVSLLAERGLLAPDTDVSLFEEGKPKRRVRIMKRIERTNGYEQWIFIDVLSDQP